MENMKEVERFVKELKSGSIENTVRQAKLHIKPDVFGESCVCTGTSLKESCMSLGPLKDSCLALGK